MRGLVGVAGSQRFVSLCNVQDQRPELGDRGAPIAGYACVTCLILAVAVARSALMRVLRNRVHPILGGYASYV